MYPNGQQSPGVDPNLPEGSYPEAQNPVQGAQPGQLQQSSPVQPGTSFNSNAGEGTASVFQIQPPVKDKKKTALIIILIVSGVVIVAAAILLYVLFFISNKPQVQEKVQLAPLKSTAYVKDIEVALKKKYPAKELRAGEDKTAPRLTVTDEALAPKYKTEGYRYYTQYDAYAAFSYELTTPEQKSESVAAATADDIDAEEAQKETTEAISDIVLSTYKKSELSEITSDAEVSEKAKIAEEEARAKDKAAGITRVASVYTGRGVACTIVATNTATVQKGTVSCGELEEYKKTAAEMQPFADSLTNVTQRTTLKHLTTIDSDTGGYERAHIQVIDAADQELTAYFYKKDAGRWTHLVTSKDEVLACSTFTTIEAQRAYLNVPCKDPANPAATVKVLEKK